MATCRTAVPRTNMPENRNPLEHITTFAHSHYIGWDKEQWWREARSAKHIWSALISWQHFFQTKACIALTWKIYIHDIRVWYANVLYCRCTNCTVDDSPKKPEDSQITYTLTQSHAQTFGINRYSCDCVVACVMCLCVCVCCVHPLVGCSVNNSIWL